MRVDQKISLQFLYMVRDFHLEQELLVFVLLTVPTITLEQ
jgi:hypothetical protein